MDKDYNAEMLKLYFEEKNFTSDQINKLLEDNPFDSNFIEWENRILNENKLFANTIKKKNLIENDIPIQEITVHQDNNIGSYLHNNVSYTQCSINESITNVRLQNKLILIKGFYPYEVKLFERAQKYNIPFITGVCTKEPIYYHQILDEYIKMRDYLKNCQLIADRNKDQRVIILRTKK